MKKAPVVFLVAVCVCLITTAGMGISAEKLTVRVTGADSMFGRLHTISQLFEKENPTIDVKVVKGETVDAGFAALIGEGTDVAMASRKIADQESEAAKAKGIVLEESLIGHGGIVIVTHTSNPVKELSVEQVQKLLRGDCVNWKELGGRDEAVKVFGIGPKHPGTVIFIRDVFLGKSPLCQGAQIMPDFPTMMARIAATPGSVGFVRIRDAYEYPGAGKCQVINIKVSQDSKSVMPCRASVSDGSYPIRRPYYLYFNGKAPDHVKKFVQFIVSKGWGQQTL